MPPRFRFKQTLRPHLWLIALIGMAVPRSLLFGISPTDPVTFAAITLLLGTVSILACYLPARKAAGLDAMVALRRE